MYFNVQGTWTHGADLPIPAMNGGISVPTRGPSRRVLVNMSVDLHEFVENAGVWTDVATHTPAELGLSSFRTASYLSPDGLRLLMGDAVSQLMGYADRPSVDAPFNPVKLLPNVPEVDDPFMTEDCGRIYMSGLDSVFYVQQQ